MFHQHFSKYMESVFGRDIGVVNEATKEGNKSIDELKRGTAKKELEEIREQTEVLRSENRHLGARVHRDSLYINSLESKKSGLEKEIKALETKFKGKQMTAERLEQIKPEKDLFGNIRNITVEDIENLKGMAMTTAKYRTAWKRSTEETERLTQENEELKNKVPTMKERMARAERESKLTEENNRLKGQIAGFNEIIERLPDDVYAELEKVMTIYIEEQRENRHEERDMGYELGD
jgi:predicted nuclease with TOPRIM domain